jgi:hypothetical protein
MNCTSLLKAVRGVFGESVESSEKELSLQESKRQVNL